MPAPVGAPTWGRGTPDLFQDSVVYHFSAAKPEPIRDLTCSAMVVSGLRLARLSAEIVHTPQSLQFPRPKFPEDARRKMPSG